MGVLGLNHIAFRDVLERARRPDELARERLEPRRWSRAFLVYDPDGRRLEFTYDDRGIFWRE